MCRRAAVGLEPTPQAAAAARSFVVRTLSRWHSQAAADEASLAVSELVTNAVLYAQTPIEVSLTVISGCIEISVRDRDPRTPVLRPVRLDLLRDLDSIPTISLNRHLDDRGQSPSVGPSGSVYGGRGLQIIDALADEWGVAERADGKEVWLTIPVNWSFASRCPCEEGRDRAASGRSWTHVTGPWDDDR